MPKTNEPKDAIELLKKDHKEVKAMFKQYDELGDRAYAAKKKLAEEICQELTKHAAAEEEIFYPAFRAAVAKSDDMVDEAVVEHAGAKDLIAQIQSMDPQDDLYDAKVKVLGEQIDHHVKEEEDEMFPKAQKASLDLEGLGEEMAAFKEQMQADLA